jgi:hypothetical protein
MLNRRHISSVATGGEWAVQHGEDMLVRWSHSHQLRVGGAAWQVKSRRLSVG